MFRAFANPFYRASSLAILLFFASWGVWWSFFQIWLTTKQGFSGTEVGTIYALDSAATLVLMFVYGSVQDKLGLKKYLLLFFVACEICVGPFFTWVYVPILSIHFYLGATVGALYLSVSYLAACPVLEAVTERMSRRFSFEYGQARAWGSFGYALSVLGTGFLFTMNPYFVFWAGSVIAVLLFCVLLFLRPEAHEENRRRYENLAEEKKANSSPSLQEILGVLKMPDVWKIIAFVLMCSFYSIFDGQMFPEFFTRFFKTTEEGQMAYSILNSVQVFLEALMMCLVPILMRKIGVRKTLLLAVLSMFIRIGGCGLVTNPLGVAGIKLLHAPETALLVLSMFRYFTLHFDTRVSATLYMVGFQIAGAVGGILFSTPFGILRDSIGYQQTFLVIAGLIVIAGFYAAVILKKDNEEVGGQALEK